MKNRFFISILMTTIIISANVWAATSGSCGGNCSWTFENGVLNIIGSGTIPDNYNTWTNSDSSIGIENYKTAVKNIVINSGITSIPYGAFKDMVGVTNVTIPDTVTKISDSSFYGMSGVTNLEIPDSVTRIDNGAFCHMSGVTNLTIPGNLTTIKNSTFSNMTNVKNLTIPDSVTKIEGWAFHGMASVESLTIPNSVTEIGYQAFEDMSGVKDLVIPSSVTTVGYRAFNGMHSLNNLTIEDLSAEAIISNLAFLGLSPANLTISSEMLERYLNASGGFKTTGDLNIVCNSGDCKAVLEAWDAEKGTDYAIRATVRAKSQQIVNADGSISIYENGQLVSTRGKRIYTVEEAERVSKPTGNKIMIRYK